MSASSSACGVVASSSWWNERMPASAVCSFFAPDVDLRGGIGADEHRGEARLRPAAGDELAHALGDALAYGCGDGLAVQDLCAHGGRGSNRSIDGPAQAPAPRADPSGRVMRSGAPSLDTAATLAQRGPGGVSGRWRAVQRMRGVPPARTLDFEARVRGDPPKGGLIPGVVEADAATTRGPGASKAAQAAAPHPFFRLPRGAMNYSIRNLVIAGGLAILAIVAVLIYTSNVKQSAKEGQARVKVYVAQRRRSRRHARQRRHRPRRPDPEGSRAGRPAPRRAHRDRPASRTWSSSRISSPASRSRPPPSSRRARPRPPSRSAA